MNIFSVRIDSVEKKEACESVRRFLHEDSPHVIFTPNPEMLFEAARHAAFRDVLNRGTLNICDGFGIQLMTRGALTRIPGIELLYDICRIAQEENKSVYFLGSGSTFVVQELRKNIQKMFPDLRIAGVHPGPAVSLNRGAGGTAVTIEGDHDMLLAEIAQAGPDILFVGFGHGKQEFWIDTYLPELPSIKIAMGVGGAFDMIAGRLRRAPRLWQKLGLEWLWRGLQEPSRAKRLWRAVIVFPWLYMKEKMIRHTQE